MVAITPGERPRAVAGAGSRLTHGQVSTGFTLGKFAPFHNGHRLVIDTAQAETDHVIVLVYDAPSTTRVPLSVRAGWIRSLYPDVEVIEGPGAPEDIGATPAIEALQERYILSMVGNRQITHFFSSEDYGAHVARVLGARDRRVDAGRIMVPISGTEVRRDPWRHRHLIDPLVYCDLITRVVFIGAPSTGKTTIARRMADELNTVWLPEYGREYWELNQVDRRLRVEQLLEIAEEHVSREAAAVLQANRYLFVDTDATTTYQFSMDYHGRVAPRLESLATEASQRYRCRFLCQTDIPYHDSWDRSGAGHRGRFQHRVLEDLKRRNVPFIELGGSIEDRVARVNECLTQLVVD